MVCIRPLRIHHLTLLAADGILTFDEKKKCNGNRFAQKQIMSPLAAHSFKLTKWDEKGRKYYSYIYVC